MNSYNLMYRGDGFSMFKGAKIIKNTGILDCEVVEQYLTTNLQGVIPDTYAKAAGRITLMKPITGIFTDVKPVTGL